MIRGPGGRRRALVTGITGQDGSYLAELLLAKGYEVHGLKRSASRFNTQRIDHLYQDPHEPGQRIKLHYGDLTDATGLIRLLQAVQPDELYHLAGQSHVRVGFATPEYAANAGTLGTLRLLEAIRILRLEGKTRFYQASGAGLFGAAPAPQSEATPMAPRSPHATAGLCAYWIARNYREGWGVFAANGILFNHESPRRGETFVGRKITRGVAAIELGLQDRLWLGNLDARRDWGHARDYVEGIWRILQHDVADDWVLATGEAHSVRDFVERAFACVGRELVWQGRGLDEKGIDRRSGQLLVAIDPRYLRPLDVDTLRGDAAKARARLGWRPAVTFDRLVAEMVAADLDQVRREELARGRTASHAAE